MNGMCLMLAFVVASSVLPNHLILEANITRFERIFPEQMQSHLFKQRLHERQESSQTESKDSLDPTAYLQTDYADRQYGFSFKNINSGGRIYNEWLPAFQTWRSSSIVNRLFGIGIGKSFQTADGRDRRYIHNAALYHLVYHGIAGLILYSGLILLTLVRQIRRLISQPSWANFGLFTTFVAVGIYAQFFAIAKLLSFNFIVFAIMATVRDTAQEQWVDNALSAPHQAINTATQQ